MGKEKVVRVRTAHLLRWDIKGDGPHVHLDEAVSAWQDKKQACKTYTASERHDYLQLTLDQL